MTCLHLPLLPVLMLAYRVLLVEKLCLESLDIKMPSYREILEIFMLVAGLKLKVLDPY